MALKRKKSSGKKTKKSTPKKSGSLAGLNKLKKITTLARKIRNGNEKWTNAIKRASKQLRNT